MTAWWRRLAWDISERLAEHDVLGGAESGGMWSHDEWSMRERARRLRDAGATIAESTGLGRMTLHGPPAQLSIGQNCHIQHRVTIVTDGWAAVVGPGRWSGTAVTIHDNCAIYQGAWILPGVTIGPNALVAPGSVVARDIPSGYVAMGEPARPIMTLDMWAERTQVLRAAHPEEWMHEPQGLRIHTYAQAMARSWLEVIRAQRTRRNGSLEGLPTPEEYQALFKQHDLTALEADRRH